MPIIEFGNGNKVGGKWDVDKTEDGNVQLTRNGANGSVTTFQTTKVDEAKALFNQVAETVGNVADAVSDAWDNRDKRFNHTPGK